MSQIDDLLEHARLTASGHLAGSGPVSSRRVAVLTCMDTRIDIARVLGAHVGEVNVLRNAGARVTDDVLRSLAVATHLLELSEVLIMQHTGCGLEFVTDHTLRQRTGADLAFLPIDDHAATLRADVDLVARTAYLAPLSLVCGCLYDLQTGSVTELARVQRDPAT